jgi:hypothetical protein
MLRKGQFSRRVSLGKPVLLDSYSQANCNGYFWMYGVFPSASARCAAGQSFTVPSGRNYAITSAKFYLDRSGSPSGDLVAQLYAHSGTYGSNGVPTGSALAQSNSIPMSSLPSSPALITFVFSGGQQYVMSAGTHYCIECVVLDATVLQYPSNCPGVGCKTTSGAPRPSGNANAYLNGWGVLIGYAAFYVYGR